MNMKLKKLLNDIQKTEDKIAELQEHLKRQIFFLAGRFEKIYKIRGERTMIKRINNEVSEENSSQAH